MSCDDDGPVGQTGSEAALPIVEHNGSAKTVKRGKIRISLGPA
jgi:hypothetical protein